MQLNGTETEVRIVVLTNTVTKVTAARWYQILEFKYTFAAEREIWAVVTRIGTFPVSRVTAVR